MSQVRSARLGNALTITSHSFTTTARFGATLGSSAHRTLCPELGGACTNNAASKAIEGHGNQSYDHRHVLTASDIRCVVYKRARRVYGSLVARGLGETRITTKTLTALQSLLQMKAIQLFRFSTEHGTTRMSQLSQASKRQEERFIVRRCHGIYEGRLALRQECVCSNSSSPCYPSARSLADQRGRSGTH